jgi:ribose-phosphate pyrophosphokinase
MLKIYVDGSKQEVKTWKFPGGEVGVNVGQLPTRCNDLVIETLMKSSDDIMMLIMAVDAIDRITEMKSFRLIMSYAPYARQDRVCNEGESLSIAAFARIINSLGFTEVTVDDPHSPQTLKYLHNCVEVPQHELMWQNKVIRDFIQEGDVMLVAPDKGAAIKIRTHLARHPKLDACVVQMDKLRDLKTGAVIGLTVDNIFNKAVTGKHLLIADDICDGGRTFIEAAKLLQKELKPLSISLYVTHGIFSKGKEVLHEAGISNVWCHNDFTRTEA